ncbi:MAG: FAD:protein FMN transferase [Candidatus Woesearchaeota archaeon]|jgi:thiamine biosynthesis lipoprotein|nr:FAD:protein FMN transferase [Candidatus Woesearchaeota archaeon]MDP7506605.1 FAD:protein FMN transferase [Candidatus Woesearchaeota archaeon]MDP7610260.1 FAD:protein FMN transferase [Candidatus Woesearchaeota archaeon]|tara:strand:+ start:9429 stop:10391 length:963 start_codon:yes stop_codon:yes gene_type:complete
MKKKKLGIIILLLLITTGCVQETNLTKTRELMGTIVSITVIDKDTVKASQSIDLAFTEIERINSLMSHYNNQTQVGILNNEGILKNPDTELINILRQSEYYSALSNGAFDITVQPLLELYTNSFQKTGKPPSEKEIKTTLSLVNYQDILIEETSISFDKTGMRITLGGIAKGYAVDKAIGVLKANNIDSALINAGGDIRAIGNKGKEDWSIALRNPRDEQDYITIINLNNKAVATSGDYERYFVDKSQHHIINPKTGKSALDLISVTILAEKAVDADALATSVFVLGADKGLALIESLSGVEGLLITEEKEVIKSKGFEP